EDLPRLCGVCRGDLVAKGAGRTVASQLEHLGPVCSQDAANRSVRRGVGRLERIQLVEVFDHGRHGCDPRLVVAAESQAEDVAGGVGGWQKKARAVRPPGPARPDLRDGVDDVHPLGARKQIAGVGERLAPEELEWSPMARAFLETLWDARSARRPPNAYIAS